MKHKQHSHNTNDTSINKNIIERPEILSNLSTINTNNYSFSATTAKSNYPKMNQAIVLNSLDGARQIEYITAKARQLNHLT